MEDDANNDDRKTTPLHRACGRVPYPLENNTNDVDCLERRVKLLLENGADVNAKDDKGRTPLHESSWNAADLELAKLLIKNGADVNPKDDRGSTPLHARALSHHHAPHGRDLELAQLLIDVDCLERVKLLLENGADVNAKDDKGRTPLHESSRNADLALAKLLIENGANVNAKDNRGSTPLHFTENLELAKLLIENGANVNAKNVRGVTPLHFAFVKEETSELLAK